MRTKANASDNKSPKDTRRKILEAAELEFAEKGYDGSRVDEISRRAGVNKALLYYHFSSKEILLEELIKANVASALEIVEVSFRDVSLKGKQDLDVLFDKLLDFIESRKNILRILTVEALKMSVEKDFMYQILDPLYRVIIEKLRESGGNIGDEKLFRERLFFFLTLPIIAFFSVGDQWVRFHGTTAETAKIWFKDSFKRVRESFTVFS